ncbi:MAG: hypothetical protein WCO69_00485 [Candidatus Omnitrophota bacterium]
MLEPQLQEYRYKKMKRGLLLTLLIILGLFITAALMHIGAGDAEWSGMTVSNMTPALQMEFSIPKDEKGVVVNWCEDPAFASGVRGGDVIKSINNKPTLTINDFLKVTKVTDVSNGVLLDILRQGQPLFITMQSTGSMHDTMKKMLNIDPGTTGHGLATPVAQTTEGAPVAMKETTFGDAALAPVALVQEAGAAAAPVVNRRAPTIMLPSPKEQGAAHKELVEGHWLGMELIPLVPELAKEFGIAPDTKGLLVDEISLESAESGILAGDMVIGVEHFSTPDLAAFTEATRRVKNAKKARVQVNRRGRMMEFTFVSDRTLGFSQNEAAQPIKPGALAPHRKRQQGKPCTACHIIMITGGQLPTDAGDILPTPPPITKGAVAPHEFRGKCNNCHIILKPAL